MSQTYRKVVRFPFQFWKSAYVSLTNLACFCRPITGYMWFTPLSLHSLTCQRLKHFNSPKVNNAVCRSGNGFPGVNRSKFPVRSLTFPVPTLKSLPPFKNMVCPSCELTTEYQVPYNLSNIAHFCFIHKEA